MVKKVCVIGGGNWGTTISKLIAENIHGKTDFDPTVILWCYEEMIENRKISDFINQERINKKYLDGVKLPANIFVTCETEAIKDCDILFFALPHQFVKSVCETITIKEGAAAISLTKGFIDDECTTAAEYLSKHYSTDVGVLMGANIANEISKGALSTSTLACTNGKEYFLELLNCAYFKVTHKTNAKGAEICGSLKNVVAIAYGIACGLGCCENTKAAILGTGLKEVKGFLEINNIDTEILFESCGVPDLIVTCMAGRNCIYGQKLVNMCADYKLCQGVGTAKGVYNYLLTRDKLSEFQLFETVHLICIKSKKPEAILECVH